MIVFLYASCTRTHTIDTYLNASKLIGCRLMLSIHCMLGRVCMCSCMYTARLESSYNLINWSSHIDYAVLLPSNYMHINGCKLCCLLELVSLNVTSYRLVFAIVLATFAPPFEFVSLVPFCMSYLLVVVCFFACFSFPFRFLFAYLPNFTYSHAHTAES